MITAGFIVREEEGRVMATHPYWPGGSSGVTLPVGYDLGQVDQATFIRDWWQMDRGPAFILSRKCVGMKGPAASLLVRSHDVASIEIPSALAMQVFESATLPRYVALCERTFPAAGGLPDPIHTALVSLCFNRGGIPLSKSDEPSGDDEADRDRYSEERNIRADVAYGRWEDIALQLRSMKRLWPDQPGLQKRREDEALLCETWKAAAA